MVYTLPCYRRCHNNSNSAEGERAIQREKSISLAPRDSSKCYGTIQKKSRLIGLIRKIDDLGTEKINKGAPSDVGK